jgi:hypothetical protein
MQNFPEKKNFSAFFLYNFYFCVLPQIIFFWSFPFLTLLFDLSDDVEVSNSKIT